MRLWTIRPQYLDTKGLLAAWREALLTQKVLQGATKGYRNHPQLDRFKSSPDPVGAIAIYLRHLYEDASSRGYRFTAEKIAATDFDGKIPCTRGQLLYEWNHLKEKLKSRDAVKYEEINRVQEPQAHPFSGLSKEVWKRGR
jgi:hypothetical protein